MQQSLLRVLQEKEIQPIGGNPKTVDVRIIAATNKDLIQLCNKGKFRWDLYYRLAVVELELPTLMERGQNDIKELIEFFIRKKKQVLKKNKKLAISAKLNDFLLSYPYPGNVRELENMIENLYVIFNGKTVDISDLPKRFNQLPVSESLKWKDVEKQLIIKVLELKNGNKSQTNQTLGYGSINTLNNKIKEYDINN